MAACARRCSVLVNVLYTLSWLVELAARVVYPTLSPRFAPVLLKVGLSLGMFLSTIPAAFWGGYRLLQIAGIAE